MASSNGKAAMVIELPGIQNVNILSINSSAGAFVKDGSVKPQVSSYHVLIFGQLSGPRAHAIKLFAIDCFAWT